MDTRLDSEIVICVKQWGWSYHHIGIPTNEKKEDEVYLSDFKFYVSGFPTSPFGIEWMRFDADSPIHSLIQTVPHLAFIVKNLDYELKNRNLNIIVEPNRPSNGVRVAMVEHNGVPIELMEFVRI